MLDHLRLFMLDHVRLFMLDHVRLFMLDHVRLFFFIFSLFLVFQVQKGLEEDNRR